VLKRYTHLQPCPSGSDLRPQPHARVENPDHAPGALKNRPNKKIKRSRHLPNPEKLSQSLELVRRLRDVRRSDLADPNRRTIARELIEPVATIGSPRRVGVVADGEVAIVLKKE
jgi:hypothetical protein